MLFGQQLQLGSDCENLFLFPPLLLQEHHVLLLHLQISDK